MFCKFSIQQIIAKSKNIVIKTGATGVLTSTGLFQAILSLYIFSSPSCPRLFFWYPASSQKVFGINHSPDSTGGRKERKCTTFIFFRCFRLLYPSPFYVLSGRTCIFVSLHVQVMIICLLKC